MRFGSGSVLYYPGQTSYRLQITYISSHHLHCVHGTIVVIVVKELFHFDLRRISRFLDLIGHFLRCAYDLIGRLSLRSIESFFKILRLLLQIQIHIIAICVLRILILV